MARGRCVRVRVSECVCLVTPSMVQMIFFDNQWDNICNVKKHFGCTVLTHPGGTYPLTHPGVCCMLTQGTSPKYPRALPSSPPPLRACSVRGGCPRRCGPTPSPSSRPCPGAADCATPRTGPSRAGSDGDARTRVYLTWLLAVGDCRWRYFETFN